MPGLPTVSIVVLNWNGLEHTRACIESVRGVDYPTELLQIVVVDNGSSDGSAQEIATWPNVDLVVNPVNRGFAAGHVDGLRRARGDVIVLLNNDAVVRPDFLQHAIPHFENPVVAAVGGRSYRWDRDHIPFDESADFLGPQFVSPVTADVRFATNDDGAVRPVNSVSGACLIVHRRAIDRIGYLPESFFAYYEETDWIARAKRAGLVVVYDPNVKIWHRIGASSAATPAFVDRQMTRNRWLFAVRNFDHPFLTRFARHHGRRVARSAVDYAKFRRIEDRAVVSGTLAAVRSMPRAIAQRRSVLRKGSEFNRLLVEEAPDPYSAVVVAGSGDIAVTIAAVRAQTAPCDDVIAVVPERIDIDGAITVVDRRLFDVDPAVLGALHARHDLVWTLRAGETPDPHAAAEFVWSAVRDEAPDWGTSPFTRKPGARRRARPRLLAIGRARRQAKAARWTEDPERGHWQPASAPLDNGAGPVRRLYRFARYSGFGPTIRARHKSDAPTTVRAGLDTPIFVVCRDRLEPLRQLLAWLENTGYRRVVLVDNDSTWPPLLEYYKATPHQVIRLRWNGRHTAPWNGIVDALAAAGSFVVTDPDVVPDETCPPDVVARLAEVLNAHPGFEKVGLGLRIDDLPAAYRHRDEVIAWESRYWQYEISPSVYDAPVDTTFALYRGGAPYCLYPALRTGPPLVARHLPWYDAQGAPSDEERHYRERAVVTHWSDEPAPERVAEARRLEG